MIVSIEYKGRDKDLELSWHIIAKRNGGTFESSGFFIPTEVSDIQWRFLSLNQAYAFADTIERCIRNAKAESMMECIVIYDPDDDGNVRLYDVRDI